MSKTCLVKEPSICSQESREAELWSMLVAARRSETNSDFSEAESIYLRAVRYGLQYLDNAITANATFQLSALYAHSDKWDSSSYWWQRTRELMGWR